ncbi:hypothetical protein EDD86DRAFT_217152 [Gorgonomyces haynaldii]|nr:hypothetical protein EDD86DRAFT_217152 [Gorgonomyces haynaldii]
MSPSPESASEMHQLCDRKHRRFHLESLLMQSLPLELIQHLTLFLDLKSYLLFDQSSRFIRSISKPMHCEFGFGDFLNVLSRNPDIALEMIKSKQFITLKVPMHQTRTIESVWSIVMDNGYLDIYKRLSKDLRFYCKKLDSCWSLVDHRHKPLVEHLLGRDLMVYRVYQLVKSEEMALFVLQHPHTAKKQPASVYKQIERVNPYFAKYWINNHNYDCLNVEKPFVYASTEGDLEFVQKLFHRMKPSQKTKAASSALTHGHRDIFLYLHSKKSVDVLRLSVSAIAECFKDPELYQLYESIDGFHERLPEIAEIIFSQSDASTTKRYLEHVDPEPVMFEIACLHQNTAAALSFLDNTSILDTKFFQLAHTMPPVLDCLFARLQPDKRLLVRAARDKQEHLLTRLLRYPVSPSIGADAFWYLSMFDHPSFVKQLLEKNTICIYDELYTRVTEATRWKRTLDSKCNKQLKQALCILLKYTVVENRVLMDMRLPDLLDLVMKHQKLDIQLLHDSIKRKNHPLTQRLLQHFPPTQDLVLMAIECQSYKSLHLLLQYELDLSANVLKKMSDLKRKRPLYLYLRHRTQINNQTSLLRLQSMIQPSLFLDKF